MFTPLSVHNFISRAGEYPVIDVRAPQEFEHGHIPGAYNVPLFSDDQRAVVGTLYKQEGKHAAIKVGLELVTPQLTSYITSVDTIFHEHRQTAQPQQRIASGHDIPQKNTGHADDLWNLIKPALMTVHNQQAPSLTSREQFGKKIFVYCARGGMRSKSFCMLLASCGYTVYQLVGGYKGFKQYLRKQATQKYKIVLVGGKTGCGKTALLHELKNQGEQVLDLEALAHHKGSVFGGINQPHQPTQEQFIVNCLSALIACGTKKIIWAEKESYKIGNLSIPSELWNIMQAAPIVYIDIPHDQRLKNIMIDYGAATTDLLKVGVQALAKKLGGARTQALCAELDAGNIWAVATALLDYYDSSYTFSLEKNKDARITHVTFAGESLSEQAHKLKHYVY